MTSTSRATLSRILGVALRWAAGWGLTGLVIGFLLMVDKTPPFAEPGGRPGSIFSYAFWVPATAGVGAAFGFVIGALFASLMALTERLGGSPLISARFGPSMLCGAAAGAILSLFLPTKGSVFLLAGLGAGSAAVSVLIHRRRSQGS